MKVSDVIDAIEKNGYPQLKSIYIEWTSSEPGKVGVFDKTRVAGACAIGQAALNLGISWTEIDAALDDIRLESEGKGLSAYIIKLNDENGLSCKEIAAELRKDFPEILDLDLDIEAGNAYEVANASGS